MTIRARCPLGHLWLLDEQYAGMWLRCGLCGRKFRVPVPRVRTPRLVAPPVDLTRVPVAPVPPASEPAVQWPMIAAAAEPEPQPAAIPMVAPPVEERPAAAPAAAAPEPSNDFLPWPPNVYEPDPREVLAVQWLVVALLGVLALSLAPVAWLGYFNLQTAPAWAQVVLLTALLEGLLVAWLLSAPDWATLRVHAILLAVATTGYAALTTMMLVAPAHRPLPLGLGSVRHTAAPWAALMVLAFGASAAACGWLSSRWHRRFERERQKAEGGRQYGEAVNQL